MKRNITSNNVGGFTSTDAKCLGSKIAGDVVSEARLTREKQLQYFASGMTRYDRANSASLGHSRLSKYFVGISLDKNFCRIDVSLFPFLK